LEGFGQYTTSASGALLGRQNATRLELLEDSADQILDLIFVEKETPLQSILLEQFAKIMASGGRSVFAQMRERSGVLPTGRTVLGTLVDPFGLFRTSPLIRSSDIDEKTIETTRKLVELAQRQLRESLNPAFDLTDLSREERIALASILTRKGWERRSGIFQTSNRLLRQLLVLTADRLESAERDRLSAPPPSSENDKIDSQRKGIQEHPNEHMLVKSSPRLDQARKLLDSYQEEESEAEIEVVTRTQKVT